MIPSVMGWKRVGIAIVACSGLACAGQPVEPRVTEAFERAVERYPEPMRVKLEKIGLAREPDYGVPEGAPLMLRLLGEAAYAYFSSMHDRVVILDAGLAERAAWTGGDASREEVAGLMTDLASALDAPEADVEAQWEAFAAAVQGWEGEPRIAGEIRLGDARVLDRFVRLGVGRALAREWELSGALDLDAQMIHELAHAAQLTGQGMAVSAHLHAWGTLSGWVRADRNEPFDGFHGGMMMMEQPAVLGRLLLSGERGEGWYAHAPGARFVNLYAAYDAREDYAESVRLFFEQPGKLLEIAPEKFLFINAIGYNSGLDVAEPGPLWISESEIFRLGWQNAVRAAAAELLRGREGIEVDPRTVAALLRAHAGVLRADWLPRTEVAARMPRDVPRQVREVAPLKHFVVEVEGERFGPPRESVLRHWEELAVRRLSDIEFDRSMQAMLGVDEASIRKLKDAAPGLGAEERASRIDAVLSIRVGVPDQEELAAWVREEVRAMEKAHRPLLARAMALRLAMVTDDEAELDEKIHSARELAARFSTGYDAAELGRVLVDAMLQRGDVAGAVGAADGIEGDLWGLLRRVEALCAIAQKTGEKVWLERAEGEIERSGRGEGSPLWREAHRMIRDGEIELREKQGENRSEK